MNDRHQRKPYPLRIPDELRQYLEASARRNWRSLNAEIVARLERGKTADGESAITGVQEAGA